MRRQVPCRTCGKVTWAGCGQHVDGVMRGVATGDRCSGHESEPPPKGLLARLIGR